MVVALYPVYTQKRITDWRAKRCAVKWSDSDNEGGGAEGSGFSLLNYETVKYFNGRRT